VVIQTYMNFLGGSVLALVIMNLTSPLLDNVGLRRPTREEKKHSLPKAKSFESATALSCIKCGACMVVCCHNLSPILIKQAFDKNNLKRLGKLNADFCTGCGSCSFVCPARIDLKGSVLRAKVLIRKNTPDQNT